MKKKTIMLITIFLLIYLTLNIFSPQAKAQGCPSNYCMVTINNGIETWSDTPKVEIVEPIIQPSANNSIQVTLSDGNKGGTIYGDQEGVQRFTKMLGLNPETTTIHQISSTINTPVEQIEQKQLGTSEIVQSTLFITNDVIIYPDWWDFWLNEWILFFSQFNWWLL